MKKILLLILGLHCVTAMAQSISPDVIAASGSSFSDGTSQLDWTLGETVTSTISTGTDLLTQGFHQPEMLVTSISNNEDTGVSVFPNPTMDFIQVEFTSRKENTIIELYTVDGKLLHSKAADNKNVQLDMSAFGAGNYLLCVKEFNGKTNTYKISKTN